MAGTARIKASEFEYLENKVVHLLGKNTRLLFKIQKRRGDHPVIVPPFAVPRQLTRLRNAPLA